jgi:hypothetical protein
MVRAPVLFLPNCWSGLPCRSHHHYQSLCTVAFRMVLPVSLSVTEEHRERSCWASAWWGSSALDWQCSPRCAPARNGKLRLVRQASRKILFGRLIASSICGSLEGRNCSLGSPGWEGSEGGQISKTADRNGRRRLGVPPRFIVLQTLHGCHELLGIGPLDNLLYLLRS